MSSGGERVVAIAGAAGGLGPAVARRFAQDGWSLALGGRTRDRLTAVADELELPAARVDVRAVDLLDPREAEAWAAALVERFGRVDALLHLVGGWRGGQPIDEAPLADLEALHASLVRTLVHAGRAFRAPLVASGRGRFAMIGAKAAVAPTAKNAAYASAKAAAEAWTLALAHSFADEPATANVVAINALGGGSQAPASATHPDDVAAALAYLCTDAARVVNGRRVILHP